MTKGVNLMLIPATMMKTEIEQAFARIAYTDKRMYFDGCIENYTVEIKEEAEKYQFAIVIPKKYADGYILIGFISFRVHFYDSCAYNFGLIRFHDNDNAKKIMAGAIRQVIRMIDDMNLHRIDFRCVRDNPAADKYAKLMINPKTKENYDCLLHMLVDTFRDRTGEYHDTLIYELIRI